jgi:hypothetical protein
MEFATIDGGRIFFASIFLEGKNQRYRAISG